MTLEPTPTERETFAEANQLWREISRGRATVDLRIASAPVKEKALKLTRLEETIRPEAMTQMYQEAAVAWRVKNEERVRAAKDKLAETEWKVGDKVTLWLESPIFLGVSHTYRGVVKISKYGEIYVAAKDERGKASRYDLFRHNWRKIT